MDDLSGVWSTPYLALQLSFVFPLFLYLGAIIGEVCREGKRTRPGLQDEYEKNLDLFREYLDGA